MPEHQFTATVVGAGPAGLMAAEVLAEAGVDVTIYDQMPSAGRKLLLAGRGGLNITHSEPLEAFLQRYGSARSHLADVVADFDPNDLRDWCTGLNETTFVGSSGRVFPESFRSTPMLRAWLRRLDSQGVKLRVRHHWLGFGTAEDGRPDGTRSVFTDADGSTVEVRADVTIMALGGASWPRTGSDGGWVDEFIRCGLDVAPLRPANCGVRVGWTEEFVERFAGVPLKNVAVGVGSPSVRGDAMVTKSGLEGGPVYASSSEIRGSLDRDGICTLVVDLNPDLSIDQLAERLRQCRRPKDSISTWLRKGRFAPVAVALMRECTGNQIPADPERVAELAKLLPVQVIDLMPIDRAISTAGGVTFDEISGSFMLHRIPGVFVAGEMLDWEAPTGGYLLQASFSTAVAAARGAIVMLFE